MMQRKKINALLTSSFGNRTTLIDDFSSLTENGVSHEKNLSEVKGDFVKYYGASNLFYRTWYYSEHPDVDRSTGEKQYQHIEGNPWSEKDRECHIAYKGTFGDLYLKVETAYSDDTMPIEEYENLTKDEYFRAFAPYVKVISNGEKEWKTVEIDNSMTEYKNTWVYMGFNHVGYKIATFVVKLPKCNIVQFGFKGDWNKKILKVSFTKEM